MAVPTLDFQFLEHFTPIFSFILVFAIVYAGLQFTKFLGDNKVIHAVISFVIGLIFLFTMDVTAVVMTITPWFTVFFIFIIFMIMGYKLFGATDDQIKNVITHHSTIQWVIAVISIIIIIYGLSVALGPKLLGYDVAEEGGIPMNMNDEVQSTATSDFFSNVVGVFFNPKVLGFLLLFFIATFTIKQLCDPLSPKWPGS